MTGANGAPPAHSHARAHDSIDDSIRCDEDGHDTGVFEDGIMLPFTEEELMVKLRVDFIRTPRSDVLVFQNPKYQGRARIKNNKYGYNYEAHIWKVELLRLNDATYDEPKTALIQIRARNLKLSGMDHLQANLFPRKTRLVADEKGRILSIDEP